MEWVRGEIIGHGTFGTVSLAKPKKQITHLPHLIAVKSCGDSHSSSLINEESILKDLSDCPHVIRCFGTNFSSQNGEKYCNLLLEYASGGSLSDKIKQSGDRKLQEFEVRHYTKSILKGLSYIHNQGYVHCDIKPQNILLCSNKNGDIAKVADFGLAKKAGSKRGKEKVELRGTPMYMSPEMAFSGDQNFPADIWAFGCSVSEMVAGAPPWRFPAGADVAQLLFKIVSGEECPEIPEELSSEGRDFLGKCFIRDPEKRWTAQMLLDHPFVHDYDNNGISATLENCSFQAFSCSPKCPFDFPDWENSACEDTFSHSFGFDSSTLAIDRFRGLKCDRVLDWSVTESWVTVR